MESGPRCKKGKDVRRHLKLAALESQLKKFCDAHHPIYNVLQTIKYDYYRLMVDTERFLRIHKYNIHKPDISVASYGSSIHICMMTVHTKRLTYCSTV